MRCYNNPALISALTRAQKFSVELIVLAIDKEKDNGRIEKLLSDVPGRYFKNIRPLYLENYSWSNALNEANRFLETLWRPIGRSDFVLNLSAETIIFDSDIWDLRVHLGENPELVAGVGPMFRGDVQGSSYNIVRNTCAMWRLETLLKVGGFVSENDHNGGMEDYEMVRRLEKMNLSVVRRDFKVSLGIRSSADQREKELAEQAAMARIDEKYGVMSLTA